MSFTFFDLIGSVGVTIIIVTYFLLQTDRIRSGTLAYSALNAVGAALIALSLVFNFNLPAFIVELFWLLISLFGMARALGARRRRP